MTTAKTDYTEMQKKAISTRDKDLLVSAGAGSGKTTVLTQRLINRIKDGDRVTDFLVVTFMKAAASDIKRKLYDALLSESAKDPQNTHLYRQSLLVSEADICTISAYCLALVKENFAVLGISPRVRVTDETESDLLLRRVADELIAEGYDAEDREFLLLADNFTGDKNDTPLAESLMKLYNDLRVIPDREAMLLTCAERLKNEADIIRAEDFFATQTGKEIQSRLRDIYDEYIADANDIYSYAAAMAADDKYLEPLEKLVSAFEQTRLALEADYVTYSLLAETSFSIKLASKGCEKESAQKIGEMKKKLMEEHGKTVKRYVRGNPEYNSESFIKSAEILIAVNNFLNKLDERYSKAKQEHGVLDYTDFEQKALALLETKDENGNYVPTELCLKKRALLKEILIDEYQDVNPMQDRIFTLLSGTSRRFMVGDVKQSIYRFRNAYPDIFIGYKEEFPNIESRKASENACIFLRENFRCGESIINYVNYLFREVTSETRYFREYDGEWLKKAATRPDRKHPVVIAVAEKESGDVSEARRGEAEYIAREIQRLINEETSDSGEELKYSDFAVMLGAMKGYSVEYEKAFAKYGIPYKTETTRNFLENPDIRLAVSALKAIDDPTDDISLCALMRSPVCNFDSNDLYRIRRRVKDTSFWNALCVCATPSPKRISRSKFRFVTRCDISCLAVRCRGFIAELNEWRSESTGISCRDFLKSFFVSSGLLRIAAVSGNRESMLLLYEYANRYESAQNVGLSGFLDYLAELSSGDKTISDAARSGDNDAVSFITVHKSKGLEFKVCFLAGTQKEFRGIRNSSGITISRGEGVYFPLRDRVNFTVFDPLCNINAVDKERESAIGEELRKLYVALTRAKERLYITGCADIGWQEKRYSKTSAKSWLDMVLYSVCGREEQPFYSLRTIGGADGSQGYFTEKKRRVIEPTPKMAEIVKYVYPHSESSAAAKKIAVSELREGLLEDDEYNRTVLSVPVSRVSLRPAFASQQHFDAAEIGTANHLFMQFCNFANVDKYGVAEEAERLRAIRMISPAQCRLLDISALERFFVSDIYRRITASPRVYREKRFSVSDTLFEKGETILVQGVIDCFFENPDGSFTVVDYKTDRVKTAKELADRHRVQLAYYKRAVERMTGRAVTRTLLYSFALGCEVDI